MNRITEFQAEVLEHAEEVTAIFLSLIPFFHSFNLFFLSNSSIFYFFCFYQVMFSVFKGIN